MVSTKESYRKGDIYNKNCPSREVLGLIADKWTVLIIHALSKQTLRHNELARSLGSISQKVLTQGLRKLERNGLIKRTVFPIVPPHVEYSLTTLGVSLVHALETLALWSEKHFGAVETAREQFDEKR